MIGINSLTPDIDEVIQISGKAVTLPVLQYGHEIETAWLNLYADKTLDTYNRACMLSAAFLAGYMQGKREERARKRQAAPADA